MSKTTAETYERWQMERQVRARLGEEIARALEAMTPLWSANTASLGDGIDQRAAARLAREIAGAKYCIGGALDSEAHKHDCPAEHRGTTRYATPSLHRSDHLPGRWYVKAMPYGVPVGFIEDNFAGWTATMRGIPVRPAGARWRPW